VICYGNLFQYAVVIIHAKGYFWFFRRRRPLLVTGSVVNEDETTKKLEIVPKELENSSTTRIRSI